MIKADYNHEGRYQTFVEDFQVMYEEMKVMVAALAIGLQPYQSWTGETQEPKGVGGILSGLVEIVTPTVGGALELSAGYIMTPLGEIIRVDKTSLSIPNSSTVSYIEVVETVHPIGQRTIEESGLSVDVLTKRVGIVKNSPDYYSLDDGLEVYPLYTGENRSLSNLKELLNILLNS